MQGVSFVCLVEYVHDFYDFMIVLLQDVFTPTPFVAPQLAAEPHFFDYFPSDAKIGQRWVKSTAKKEKR